MLDYHCALAYVQTWTNDLSLFQKMSYTHGIRSEVRYSCVRAQFFRCFHQNLANTLSRNALKWSFIWFWRHQLWRNAFEQWLHAKGFLPVCLRKFLPNLDLNCNIFALHALMWFQSATLRVVSFLTSLSIVKWAVGVLAFYITITFHVINQWLLNKTIIQRSFCNYYYQIANCLRLFFDVLFLFSFDCIDQSTAAIYRLHFVIFSIAVILWWTAF